MDDRYSRQVRFAPIGEDGQRRLRASTALVVGCGALGSLQAEMLTRAGVGRLRIVDRDFVEPSNLQRQVLYTEADAAEGIPKAAAAVRHLRAVNSEVDLESHVDDLNAGNVRRLLGGADVILDGTDNFETRLLLNDASVSTGVPWIYGAAVAAYGITMNVLPDEGPCLRCLLEVIPAPGAVDTCDTAGVLAPTVGTVASLQVVEAMKLLSGRREALRSGVVAFDLWHGQLQQLAAPARRPDCPCCGERRFVHLEGSAQVRAARLCGRDSVQILPPRGRGELDLEALERRLGALGPTRRNAYLVRAEIDAHVLTVFADGRAIVGGTNDPGRARSLYARYVGS